MKHRLIPTVIPTVTSHDTDRYETSPTGSFVVRVHASISVRGGLMVSVTVSVGVTVRVDVRVWD